MLSAAAGIFFWFAAAVFSSTDIISNLSSSALKTCQWLPVVSAFTTTSTFNPRHRYHGLSNAVPTTTTSSFFPLSVLFFPERTTSSASTESASSQEQDMQAAPAYVIERISNMPTNDRLFERISNMCIDVFFKEQLTDGVFLEQQQEIGKQQLTKPGKL
jgi:hypothetical protein